MSEQQPDRPSVTAEAIFTHRDDGPWQQVRAQRHPDGTDRFVTDRYFVMSREPEYMSLLSRWDAGMVVHRHGHWSHQIVYVLRGEVQIGDRVCTEGTHIDLPLGASIGPMIAGREGCDMLEIAMGDGRSWEANRAEFLQLLTDRGITPLPYPPMDLPDWLPDRRSEHTA
jgi:hypothetical protein